MVQLTRVPEQLWQYESPYTGRKYRIRAPSYMEAVRLINKTVGPFPQVVKTGTLKKVKG